MKKIDGDQVLCPKCGGEMWNPCDPGCCAALYCEKCDVVYGLKRMGLGDSAHYKALGCPDCRTTGLEKFCPKHEAEFASLKDSEAPGGLIMERVREAAWEEVVTMMKECGGTPWMAWRAFKKWNGE